MGAVPCCTIGDKATFVDSLWCGHSANATRPPHDDETVTGVATIIFSFSFVGQSRVFGARIGSFSF
jgi:hypothetical protein